MVGSAVADDQDDIQHKFNEKMLHTCKKREGKSVETVSLFNFFAQFDYNFLKTNTPAHLNQIGFSFFANQNTNGHIC